MRTFLLFTLTVVGLGILTDDADAIGRRGRRGAAATGYYSAGYSSVGYTADYSAGYSQPVVAQDPCGGCPDSTISSPSGPALMPAPSSSSGSVDQDVVRASDGTVLYRGSDGTYSTTPQASGGQVTYPAGYSGSYSGYYPSYDSSYYGGASTGTMYYRSGGLFGRRGGYYYTSSPSYYTSPAYTTTGSYYTSPGSYYTSTGSYYYNTTPGVYQTSYPSITYPGTTVTPAGGVPLQMPRP